jgi:hypothetical protein
MPFAHPTPSASGTIASPPSQFAASFRDLIPPPDHPKIQVLSRSHALEWCEHVKKIPEVGWFIDRFKAENLNKPYRGLTTDGQPLNGAYDYSSDEGAPVEAMVAAAEDLLALLSPEQKTTAMFVLDADEMRLWSNPELYVNPGKADFICTV